MPKYAKVITIITFILLIFLLGVCFWIMDGGLAAETVFITDEQIVKAHEQLVSSPTPKSTEPPEPISDEVLWLARAMDAEDGVNWTDDDIMKIGEVVLNRVASPLYPDTIEEVLFQPGQYSPFFDYEEWMPEQRYLELASRLLNGERVLNDPDVIFQALFVQGSEVVDTVYDDALWTTTYLCK